MNRPHGPIVSFCSDEHSGVVGVAAHDALLRCFFARNRSAAASSAGVNDPFSASHARTPRSPASIRRARSAAWFSQDERLMPLRAAASDAACAVFSSRATEIFRTGIPNGSTPLLPPEVRAVRQLATASKLTINHPITTIDEFAYAAWRSLGISP
jgi:hypothetical protein